MMLGRNEAKRLARSLRKEMAARNVALTHSECLEILARTGGERDWNALAAQLDKTPPTEAAREFGGHDGGAAAVEPHWTDCAGHLYARHFTRDDMMRPALVRRAKWQALFEEANRLHASGVDGDGPEIADLARRWIECSWDTSGDDLEYKRKSARVYEEALEDPAIAPKLPLSRAVLAFLEKPLERAVRDRFRTGTEG